MLLEEGHSRMPVYDTNIDNIVGYVVARDVLSLAWEKGLVVLSDIVRPAHKVPEATRAKPAEPGPTVLHFGELEIDLERRLVKRGGEPIHVTPTEYGLLEAMVTNPGKLLTHQWLLRRVWGRGYGEESHYLRIYVRQLRRKLGDDAAAPIYVATEPGVGYRWIYEPDRN